MGAVAGLVAPIFAIILLGAAGRHWRVIDAGGLRGLTDLTFYLLIPSLLVAAVVEAPVLGPPDAAVVFFAVCLTVFALGLALALLVLRLPLARATVVALNACYGNTGMLGVPLVAAAFGADGVAVLLPVLALHSVLLLPLATMLIEADGRGAASPWRILHATLGSMLRNPIIMALLAAVLWRGLGLPVPGPAHRLLGMFAAAAPAVALFSLGASLPDFAARGNLRETGIAVGLKLVLQPALAYAVAMAVGLAPLPAVVVVLASGMPTGANAFFLARRTGVNVASSAGTVVLATALSVVTLSVILNLFGGLFGS